MFPRICSWVGLLLILAACGSSTGRGRALYAEGHFIEAAAYYERLEADLNATTAAERAEYGLYRGMTLMALGDLRRARYWLDYAQQVETAVPGSLSQDARLLLSQSLQHADVQQRREQSPGNMGPPAPAPAMSAEVPSDSDTRRGFAP